MVRRLLHYYWRFSRGLTIGVRAAVLDADDNVLLVRHGYVRGWHFPGGGAEPNETLHDALARELLEEGNVVLADAAELHGVFLNRALSGRDHVALFVVRRFEWKGPVQPGLEIREAAFFPAANLPEGTSAATRRRLDEVLRGAPISQTW